MDKLDPFELYPLNDIFISLPNVLNSFLYVDLETHSDPSPNIFGSPWYVEERRVDEVRDKYLTEKDEEPGVETSNVVEMSSVVESGLILVN